jgi:hypothetical protein
VDAVQPCPPWGPSAIGRIVHLTDQNGIYLPSGSPWRHDPRPRPAPAGDHHCRL